MNTIEQLRAALHEHAEVTDPGLAGRGERVAARGRVVRRRRRAAVVMAVVAAVAGAVGITQLPASETVEPAREVVGVPIPSTMTAGGRTYEFSEKVEEDSGEATISLPASLEPRLVSWATEGSDQRVRVVETGEFVLGQSFTSTLPDLTDYVLVTPDDAEHELRVTADGPIGLVVYTPSDAEPDGVSFGRFTYRQQIGDRTLLGAAFGSGPAEARLGVGTDVELTDGPLYVAPYCADPANTGELWVRVDIDGEQVLEQGCSAEVPGVTNPGADPAMAAVPRPGEVGDEVTVAVRLVGGGRVEDPALVTLGIGVYAGPADGPTVLGERADEYIEHDGHTWRLTSTREGGLADGGFEAAVPASDERVLVAFRARVSGTKRVTVNARMLGGDGPAWSAGFEYANGSTGGEGVLSVVDPGTGRVALQGRGAASGDVGALLFYELAD